MSQTSFEELCALLKRKKIAYQVITHKPVFTMDDVLRELNIPMQSMAKTILVSVGDKGLFRVVLHGTSLLNIQQLAKVLGVPRKSISFADKVTIEQSGFTIGAIPPFGGEFPTYIDKSLLDQDILYCGAGDNDKTFSLKPHDLVFLASASIADIATSAHKGGV